MTHTVFLQFLYLTRPITNGIIPLLNLPHIKTIMTKLWNAFFVLIFSLAIIFTGNTVFADTVCQPVYGGGQTCVTTGNMFVMKQVQNPQTGQFVDNLTINDHHFAPADIVTFKIFLRNTGGTVIPQTKVFDTLPAFTSFVSGPGIFDQNAKTLTFTVDNLNPGETRDVATIQVQVIDAKGLPDGTNCEPNSVAATPSTGQPTQTATSFFCIQKSVVTTKGGLPVFPPSKVTTTPSTGPEFLPLISLLPGGAFGWFLRKKTGMKNKGGKR